MKLKRLLAGFIAVAMTVGMIPTLVFADEAENGTKETAAVEATESKEEEKKKPEVKETKPAEEEKKELEKKAEPEEKPAESKAEEPAATEDKKEAEPAETEAPAETEEKQPAESKETEPAETEAKQPAESEDKAEPEAPAEKTPEETDSKTSKKAKVTIGTVVGISYVSLQNLEWTAYTGAADYTVLVENKEIDNKITSNKLLNVDKQLKRLSKRARLKNRQTEIIPLPFWHMTKTGF